MDQVIATLGAVPLPAETVRLEDALGRVLAEKQTASLPVPLFTNSAMDGYAVRHADLPGPLPVAMNISAGASPDALPAGAAARIMTGAPVPEGADLVVPIEDSKESGDHVWSTVGARLGQHIRHAGEDITPGEPVLARGLTLSARHLAAAASVGLGTLPVVQRPRVCVIVTGDEVVVPGTAPVDGQIPDSNGPYLCAALVRAGAALAGFVRCPDDPDALIRALDGAEADLIVLSDGASAGGRDIVRDVLGAHGCEFVHVAMQPGKPQGYGLWGGTPVVALPGNPVSAVVSFTVFVRPALDRLLGRRPAPRRFGRAARDWQGPAGRRQFMPVVVEDTVDGRTVRPVTSNGSGSHLIASLAQADALAVVPEDTASVAVGDCLQLIDLL